MYSTHNEENSVVTERFIRTLKKYMASIYKNIYINKLDDIVNKNNNKFHTYHNKNETCWYKVKHLLISIKRITKNILNLTLGTM